MRSPSLDKDVKCQHLHFLNPYLLLGPFKLENRNQHGNYVAEIHQLIYEDELEEIKDKTRLTLKKTPYFQKNNKFKFNYSKTSNIKYISERSHGLLENISKRLELATGFNIYDTNYRYDTKLLEAIQQT